MSDTSDSETEQTLYDVVQTAKERAHENDEKADRAAGDPAQVAFFNGIAAAYRSIVEEFGDIKDLEEI